MGRDISQEIAALPTLNKAELLKIWQENFPTAPPPTLRKQLMVPILAYRIQEREYGGLSHAARKRLRELAQSQKPSKNPPVLLPENVSTGTRLIRSWRGEVHEVNVTENGFEYRGQTYTSLSRIARQITGTQWSGPLFFGTRKKAQ